MSESTAKKPMPPYLPYATFKTFVGSLHSTVLPRQIDKSLMPTLSNGVQSHMMVALRFLGLIKHQRGDVTEKLERLHASFDKPDEWAAELRKLLESAYAGIIGNNDVSRMTDRQLDDAFRVGADLDGVMVDRATRFYVQAMTDAKAGISPHLLNRKRAKPKRTPKGPKNGGGNGGSNGAAPADEKPAGQNGAAPPPPNTYAPPPGSIEFPIHFRGKMPGRLIVPADLNAEDVKMVELLVPMLRVYTGAPVGAN